MANVLVVSIFFGADNLVVTGAVVAVLGAQTFRAFDNKAEALLAQGKNDDWFDSLVGKVEVLKAERPVIEGIYPNVEKAFLFGKSFESVLSFDVAVVFVMAGDDMQVLAIQLNLAKQTFATSPDSVVGLVLGGADGTTGSTVTEKIGLCCLGLSSAVRDTERSAAH